MEGVMETADKERSVRDLLRAMELCATGATIHGLANARLVLTDTLEMYLDDQSQLSTERLDQAMRFALTELAVAVWSRRSCG